jgi:uncharacterized delta-60 repeat protein
VNKPVDEFLNLNPRGQPARDEWRNVVKTIRDTLASLMPARRARAARWLKPALILALGLTAFIAGAQPNDNFANAFVISGAIGTTNGTTVGATLETCETNQINTFLPDGTPEYTPDMIGSTVWFAWTAPTNNGTAEFDTFGSGFDTVLAIWTTTNGLCGSSLTNIVANDDDPTNAPQSSVGFPVVAGRTYYIQVSGYDNGGGAASGAYILNWNFTAAPVPTLVSGPFRFTQSTYYVSQDDSTPPINADGGTVGPSAVNHPELLGARVTVTRPEPAYGRVSVNYAVTALTYQNIFMTNYFGTNIILVYVDTNNIVSATNNYVTNIVVTSSYGSYARGNQTALLYYGTTNTASEVYAGISTSTSPIYSGPMSPIPTNLPFVTNYSLPSGSVVAGGFAESFSTNIFGFLRNGVRVRGTNFASGMTFTNGTGVIYTNFETFFTNTFITNFFGTNIFITYVSTAFNGPYFSTNYYYTNIAVGYIYSTNSVYTNGASTTNVFVFGTNWNSGADTTNLYVTTLNSSNYTRTFAGSPLTPIPVPTNIPPLGVIAGPIIQTVDSSGDVTLTQTNSFSTVTINTQTVSSANGIALASGTLTFNNFEMSQDILVPVSEAAGPDAPAVQNIPGYAQITLSNPQLDPQEDSNLIAAPVISGTGTAFINALSPSYGTAGFPNYSIGPGIFNLERSYFIVQRNVAGSNAVVSVYRNGTNVSDAVTVDYTIDPARTHTYPFGMTPPNGNFLTTQDGVIALQSFTDGQANTFVLEAGSDYATPGSDFTIVSGTLSWAAFDNAPKQISIPILNNSLVENNEDLLIQLHNPLPIPATTLPGNTLGEVNSANLTILFDDSSVLGGQFPGQQPAGAADRTWNKNGATDSVPPNLQFPGTTPGNGGTVYALAEQPDGKAIIAGSFISYDSTPYNRIVRVLNNGYQDPTFQGNRSDLGNNSGANDFIAALALQPDGRIIVGGNFTAFNGYNRHYIARLNSDGSVDTTFNPGLGASAKVWSVALQPNGQIVIGGEFTSYNGTNINTVARLNADGSLDPTFNPGIGPDGIVDAVAVDANGRVLIGGNFDKVSGTASGAIARLNADGSLDTTFAPGIGTFNPETYVTDPVHALAVQADGKILIGGSFAYYNLVNQNGLVRLNTDGTLDLTFHPGTGTLNPVTGVADTVYCIALQSDGNILIGGNFVSYNQTRRVGLARVFTDGSLDTSIMDTTYNQFAGVPNPYLNGTAVSATYPYSNARNAIYAIAPETSVLTSGNIIIGGSFGIIGGGTTRVAMLPRSNVARVIGGATPGPGNMELLYNNYSVNNSDGSLYVSLTRTNGNLGIVASSFSITTAAPGPGIATAGTDFSPSAANPVWDTAWYNNAQLYSVGSAGPNFALNPAIGLGAVTGNPNVTINVFNPGNISGNLSANFGLSLPVGELTLGGEDIPVGAALGVQDSAPLTIIDSNVKAGVLGFSSPVYTVIGNGGTATITLTRTNGSDNSVTVFYATSNGTATNGVDYTGVTNSITFGIGVVSNSFTVSILSKKTSIQPDKTVNLRLFTPSGGATLGLSNAILTLVNPVYNYGHVSFSLTNYLVNENAGSTVVTVNRLGGSTGTLGVTLLTQDGTAFSGTNYTGTNVVLFWNDSDATPRTVTIPVRDDGVVTPNLVAYLMLTNAQVNGFSTNTPLSLGGTNATLTIANVDSAGSFQFSLPTYSVKKYGGYALIPVTRAGGSVGTASVSFTTADDTAVHGVNYTYTTNTLTFTNGQLSKFVSVPILLTGGTNGLKDLFLKLSNPTGLATLGSPSNATLYIIDSDSVNETPGSPDPTYSSFAGFNNNVYALVLQPNNQLLAGGDFTMANGVTRNRIARLNSDGTLDADFSLPSSTMGADASVRALALQADGRILVGGIFTNFNSTARRHIARVNPDGTLDSSFNPGSGADNPVYAVAQTFVGGQPRVLLAGAFASINGTTFNGIAQLDDTGKPDPAFNPGLGANATVYAMALQTDGKIVIGGDFTAVNGNTNFNHIARLNADGSLDNTFNPGTGAGDSVRAIAVQLDGHILMGGLFTNVNGNTTFNHIARLNSDGSIDTSFTPGLGANDAVFSISLQSDNRIVLGGEFTTCSGVTRNRITRLNFDGTVDPSINFGTGANDFVAASVIEQDTIVGYPTNVPDEKIIIGGGFTQYHNETHQHIARIFGGSIGGSGAFQFSSPSYGVHETGTNVLITVWRTGGTTNAPTGDIFITATTSNGTAVAGVNYTAVITNIDFPLGEVIRTFVVPVRDDGVVTSDLTVNLALSNPTSPAQIGNQPTAILTITNDETAVSFSSATYSVPKNIVSGTAAISIVRQGGTSGSATVSFSTTSGGTAVPVTDYTPVTQTVTFSPGVSNVTVYIPINNNGIAEGNRTVTMQLVPGAGSTIVAPTNAILTIIDTVNAPGQLAFSSAFYSITEGGGVGYTNAYITVIRTNGSSGTISVGFQTFDGTAQAGVKYLSTNGVLTFGDGESSKTFVVPVINTPTAEGPETVLLVLTNATGGATLTSPAVATLTILNTNTGIAFMSAANSFTEPSGLVAGTVTLNVVRFNNTSGTVTVNYSTTNGTAVAGTDFVGVSNGTLTFNPGESVKPITITTLHDPRVTGDLFFTVGLANPSGSAQLTTPTYTVVTDHDADAGISFLTSATSVYRNAGFVIIPVICSNTNVEPVSVNYSTGGGTAVPGSDYTPASGTLSFTNGASVSYFFVLIPPNNQVQSNRTFNVTLSNPTTPGVLVPPSVETVTIVQTNTPYGLSFLSPIIISGLWGTTNADNSLGAPEIGDPSIAGYAPTAPVWFQWTAPAGVDGEVALDTIGSSQTNGTKLDTVLAVFTGTSLANLNQVAANDDLYPPYPSTQHNEVGQNIFNTNAIVTTNYFFIGGTIVPIVFTNNNGIFNPVFTEYIQPFGGPSGLRFNAKGGTTYYIAADSKSGFGYTISNGVIVLLVNGRGPIQLSWAYHPSGVFRFASENVDQTGILGTNGNPMLLYQCAETEGGSLGGIITGTLTGHRQIGPYANNNEANTTIHAYYYYDVQGLLVTVTRVAGSSGRVSVDYTTVDGNTNIITNGDAPARAGQDYTAVQGTLIFDDYEMSKTIVIPISDDNGVPRPNRDFTVVLSNPQRDPAESGNVSAPRVDPVFGQVLCRILDCDIDPKGPSTFSTVITNVTPFGVTNVFTNTIIADQFGELLEPTNALFNFAKANYRVPRDVQQYWSNGIPVTVYVNRMGTNRSSVTVHYRFDNYFLTKDGPDDANYIFPLQPGSDYAVPTPATTAGVLGTNSDFDGVGGDSGTITFPGGNNNPFQSQPIHFNVHNNRLTAFDKDIHIGIYQEDSNGNPEQDGMVAETTVTILSDDTVPPAGAVDEFYNPDFASDMAVLTNGFDLNTSVPNPGTDPFGEVYAVGLTTNNLCVIGGAFSTYSDSTNTYTVNGLARLNPNGSLDTSFNSGSGVNVFPGNEYIRSLAVMPDSRVVIGGNFTSYNGIQRNGVARVNADGSLDNTFTPGAGANGTVWSVMLQPDGKVLIGGEFTTYNGVARNYIARLNTDGSLDTTFSSSNLITGPVYAMTAPPSTVLNFNHSASGGPDEDDQVLNLGTLTSGTLTVTYDMLAVPDDMRIFYGTTNVAGGTGVLLFDTGNVSFGNTIVLPFGPTNGFATNFITIVMNQGGSTNTSTAWFYTASISVPTTSGLIVGGHFNVSGQTYANIASLNADGSLDTTFNPGTGPDNSVLSLAWQLDNKIVVGGAFKNVSGVPLNRLARLNRDGSIDGNFLNGIGADNVVNSITLQPLAGLIYVGGSFTLMNGTHRLGFARLYSDGTVDTTFLDTAYNQFAGLPRILYVDSPGTVYSSVLQNDGNVIIGGSFQEVGGGQADKYARLFLESERGLRPSTTNQELWVSENNSQLEPKTRDGVRNRSNVARLIGGATPGPGNIGMVATTYAVNKTQATEPVNLVRVNGSLGYASANFSVLPGLAQSGVDYSYGASAPLYPIDWEYSGPSRMHSDGLFGADGLMQDIYGELWKYGLTGPASVNIFIINNTSSSGNLSAQLQLANPADADQFYLGGQNIPLGVALGESQAPLTLIDNTHQDGVFGFASPTFVASNSPTSVTIIRTNGSFGSVQLNYQTTTNGSTAVLNTDYRATNGVLSFASGQTNGSFPVTILNNGSVSAQEKKIAVQLYNIQDLSGGSAQLGLTNALVRIINPNFPGYLSFDTNAYYGNLSAGVINFTVTRTVGSKGTLTLQYGTYNGTAQNGVDYTGSTNSLTWNNGDVSARTVSVPLINHSVVGPNKQFAANLFNATVNGTNTPSLLGAITNAVFAIINDNSYGTFQFSLPSYQFNENGGYATINVVRGGSALGTASVNFSTADATAFAGTNYVATNNTLTFLPGQVVKSFNVRLLDDGKTNPPPAGFYFAVALSAPSAGSSLGSPTNSLVHLVDVESYNQVAGSVDPSFDTGAGMNASVLSLALQSNGQIVAGGNFTVVNGTAINRIARLNTDGTLDGGFLNGLAGADSSVNAVVSQTDDRVVVGGSFAKIDSISRQRIARLMTDGSLDNSFNAGAGADSTIFALAETFMNGARGIYVGGAFSTFNGISSPGVVRLNNSGGVDGSFAVGQGANGTVYAVAVYPTNSIYNAGKVLVGGLFTNFNGSAVGNLVRLNLDGSLDTNFNQNVIISGAVRSIAIQLDGNVLIGGDFTNVNATAASHLARLNGDGTLDTAFTATAVPGVNGTVNSIVVQADNRIVVAGQFSQANGVSRADITRLLPTGAVDPTINFGLGANGAINSTVIQPADGKLVIGGDFTQFNGQPHAHIARLYGGSMTGSGAFQFTSANYSVDENGSFATITVERTGGTSGTNADGSGDVYVAFTTTNGSAVAGVNYTYTTNYLDFPVGEVVKTIFVPVTDDMVITTNLTVNLILSNPTPGTGLGDQANAVLTIINDDSVVEFFSATYSVPKNTVNGYANINIVRIGSTSGSCSVNFATGTNGTAVVGTDYYPTNALITFNPGDTSEIIQVAITNNLLPEGNRTVSLALTNAANSVLTAPSNAVLTIVDTVQAPGNLFFTATNFTANSSDGLAYLSVGRTNGTSGKISATYTTFPGTAFPGLNYVATTNTVTFSDGDTNEIITVPVINNTLAQSAVSLTVSLSNPSGGGLVAPTNTTLTIYNTNAVFAFTLATNTVPEDQSPASIVVERFNNTNIISTVNYATTNGTALAGVNYSNTFGTLTFGLGESFKSISIPLINRSNVNDLVFGVGLSNPSHAQLIAPSNTVVILEASGAGISFTTNTTSVQKNAGSVLITVVCSNPRVEPVVLTSNDVPLKVNYTTRDGTARAGINYQSVSGTLVFTNGNATNSFYVPIFNNQSVVGDQAFSVVLTNVTYPGQITPYGTQAVVIAESNAGLRFSQADYTVFKNAGLATISVYRTGFTDTVVSVDYLATNGTAIAGQNFYPTNGTLVFTNGVTSQSFNVQLIANSQVQPNLFALLLLGNPTNAQVVNPGAATLTILETGGSYVIPAGAQLLTNSSAADMSAGVIGSNDTVQVMFAFRDSAGLNVTNLIAYLLPTNGVVAPSPASQTYGGLTVYGHSVSRPFSFTAQGTNSTAIAPTFQLYDNGKYIGPATFVFTMGSWTTTFANTSAIIINDKAAASPYPSLINVNGVGSILLKATVTVTNLSHGDLHDVDMLVVSPTTNTLIMAHVSDGSKATHLTLTFDDAATNSLPNNTQVLSGTNKPTQYYPVNNFP